MKEKVKAEQIHEGFPEQNIRDFLSISLANAFKNGYTLKKKSVDPSPDDPSAWRIADCEAEIAMWTERLQFYKAQAAVLTLIKSKGWQEFDVSDYITQHPQYGYLSFIGTEEEHEQFLASISL